MTAARIHPLNAPTDSELAKARDFLFEADMLVQDVTQLFLGGGDFALAARLKDIQGRLMDEMQMVEKLIAISKLRSSHYNGETRPSSDRRGIEQRHCVA